MGKVHKNDQIIKVLIITMMMMMMLIIKIIIKKKKKKKIIIIIIITTITLIKLIMTGIISITKKILCSNNKMILRPTKS